MRTDEQPLVLSRQDHIKHICENISRERINQADQSALDVLFDEQLRRVAHAMAEREETPVMRLPSPIAWLLQGLFYVGISGVVYAVFR